MALANREARVEPGNLGNVSARGGGLPVASLVFGALSCLGMMISIWMIFLYAPTEAVQGDVQRIFYFHVPLSWLGMLAYVVLTIGGIGYLLTKKERWDWLARAAASSGTVFISLALITGSIWGRVAWGTWWTWDAKLTATLILWFMFVAYLMLRSYMGRTSTSSYYGAVLGIIGVIDVPIIYLSVVWWRTLHPAAQVGVADALPPSVVWTLMVSLVSFTLFFVFLMIQLYRLEQVQSEAQQLRAIVEYEMQA